MFRKSLSLLACVLLLGAQAANAQSRCAMVDTVLQSFSVVQDIQLDTRGNRFSENLERLNRLTEQISLPQLQPIGYSAEFPIESQSLSYYMATLRDAAGEGASGDRDYARKRLSRGMPENFAASLRSLEQYWSCLPNETLNPFEASTSTKRARATEASGKAPKTAKTSQARPKAGRSEGVRGSPSISGFKTVGVSPNSAFEGNSSRFIIMLLALMGAGYYIYRRQRKRSRAREPRRIIHAPARLKIGRAQHKMIVIDITRFGLKIQHTGFIKNKARLEIEINGNWHQGQVQWQNDLFAGIKLRRPIAVKAFREYVAVAQEELALEKEGFIPAE